MENILQKIAACSSSLQQWHISTFGNMKEKIATAQKQVTRLNNQPTRTSILVEDLKKSESILDELLEQEEQYWQQRSRVDWLSSGDQNTKFFHAYASSRKASNRISSLLDSNGTKITSKDGMSNIITNFFAKLFTATTADQSAIQAVTATIPTSITSEVNASLTVPFTEAEVFAALKTMSPDKSPGSDGMSAMFYQNYWHIVGQSVTAVVLGVLNHGQNMDLINKAIITLVLKITSPSAMTDFRPISLCNVIYKIISKMIVLQFKEALPLVIFETQSAFLSNRLITDNVLVAFELVHNIQHRTRGKKDFSALKLDMSKAFDRVEWCLSSSSLTFALNGDTTGLVKPSRGLHQGDPLSPYLFLICPEGLSRLLQHEESIGNLQGLRITRQAPSISHLLFPDDILLFCEATNSSALAIQRVLDIYHKASGQMLNPHKSVMSFSPNTPMAALLFFQQALNMHISECHERYLRLPSYSDRDKKVLFSHIKERVWKLMHAWNEKLFSVARLGNSPSLTWQSIHWGRELLLKGHRYKVGNGFHIQSGNDKWIPGHTEFHPITYIGPPSFPVANFITDEREWNIDLLIDKIVSIPLSFFPPANRLVWHHTTSGEYTVKSGFHLAASLDEQQQSSSSDLHSSWWKAFWHLTLPSKVKIFAWKVMHNALPTAATLHRRKVLDSAACLMCSWMWESVGSHGTTATNWQPPPAAGLKLNVDAATISAAKKLV
uniref:Reverse transcriptase domain-containing protein n=1 Tax=Cannabis sativa TaxID=3483 RepID=A0A803PLP7_CANSA